MKVRLLPSHAREPARLQPFTSFLLDGRVALDGGSLGFGLTPDEQKRVRHVLVSHTHSDHTASLPIFVAEVYPFLETPFRIHAIAPILRDLQEHLFNERMWPDFHRIPLPSGSGPALEYHAIELGRPFAVEGLTCTAIPVNHTVETTGFLVRDGRGAVLFSGDTYTTDELWRVANATPDLRALFVDVSYPSDMEELARRALHFTPTSLLADLAKLERDVPIHAVHLKPLLRDRITAEIAALRRPGFTVAEIGREYDF